MSFVGLYGAGLVVQPLDLYGILVVGYAAKDSKDESQSKSICVYHGSQYIQARVTSVYYQLNCTAEEHLLIPSELADL